MKQRKECGFTLIEIIVVFVLLSVLTLAVLGQMMGSNADLVAGIQTLKTHLRYAQSRALSTSGSWYVVFDTGTAPGSYSLFKYVEGGTDEAKVFPGQESASIPLTDGMNVTHGDGSVVFFDDLGRPYEDASGTTFQTAVRNIVSSDAGDVEVKPETGYVP